jgi:hypothetical protein
MNIFYEDIFEIYVIFLLLKNIKLLVYTVAWFNFKIQLKKFIPITPGLKANKKLINFLFFAFSFLYVQELVADRHIL